MLAFGPKTSYYLRTNCLNSSSDEHGEFTYANIDGLLGWHLFA